MYTYDVSDVMMSVSKQYFRVLKGRTCRVSAKFEKTGDMARESSRLASRDVAM